MTATAINVLALGLALISVLITLWCMLRAQRSYLNTKTQLAVLDHRLQTATSGAIGMGQRIIVLEEKLQSLNEAALHSPDSDSAAYTQAMQLFDCGADVNTVMASCGISSSEASLMALMRQQTTKQTTDNKQVADSKHTKVQTVFLQSEGRSSPSVRPPKQPRYTADV